MNDEQFEQQLRAAFTTRLQEVSPDREARLRAVAYQPREHRFRKWPAFTATAMALTAAVVAAVVVLLGSDAQSAFAGWTQVPVTPTAGALSAARSACGSAPVSSVLAADARGPYTAIVYMHQGKPWQCVVDGRRVLLNAGTPYRPSVLAKPSAGQVSLPLVNHKVVGASATRLNRLYGEQRRLSQARALTQSVKTRRGRRLQESVFAVETGADSLTSVSGSVGRGVKRVTFVLRDGTQVQATVGDGWYLAWWPGSARPDGTDPVAIRVTTASGTERAPYSAGFLRRYYHPCLLDERCVAPPLKLIPGVASSLTKHFGLFRDTPPATRHDLSVLGSEAPIIFRGGGIARLGRNRLGLDESQIRSVSFGPRGIVWVTPGNAGVCLNVTFPMVGGRPADGDGMGGCDSLAHTLRHGTFVFGSVGDLGLVPDGNRTVTFHFGSGRERTVPVKQNVVFAEFSSTPSSVTFTNANGNPARWPS